MGCSAGAGPAGTPGFLSPKGMGPDGASPHPAPPPSPGAEPVPSLLARP